VFGKLKNVPLVAPEKLTEVMGGTGTESASAGEAAMASKRTASATVACFMVGGFPFDCSAFHLLLLVRGGEHGTFVGCRLSRFRFLFLKFGNRHLNGPVSLQEFEKIACISESCHRQSTTKKLSMLLECEGFFEGERRVPVTPNRIFWPVAEAAQDSSLKFRPVRVAVILRSEWRHYRLCQHAQFPIVAHCSSLPLSSLTVRPEGLAVANAPSAIHPPVPVASTLVGECGGVLAGDVATLAPDLEGQGFLAVHKHLILAYPLYGRSSLSCSTVLHRLFHSFLTRLWSALRGAPGDALGG
jgi:hypothetical protein